MTSVIAPSTSFDPLISTAALFDDEIGCTIVMGDEPCTEVAKYDVLVTCEEGSDRTRHWCEIHYQRVLNCRWVPWCIVHDTHQLQIVAVFPRLNGNK